MTLSFSIIVAVDEKFGIGKDGKLPWHLSADLRHFKKITTEAPAGKQNAVIMGRKTWDSLPEKFKPLPGRINVVVSRQKDFKLPPGVILAPGLQAALGHCDGLKNLNQVFVIGGGEIFSEAIHAPSCRTLYITKIDKDYHCDTHFPRDLSGFTRINPAERSAENGLTFQFLEYQRKK